MTSLAPPVPPGVVECWFDYSSPFAYLGTTQIERVAHEAGARVAWRPFLLGALFRSIGTPVVPIHTFSDAKRRHALLDLERWADWWSVPYRFPSSFPVRTVAALRLTLLVPDEARAPLIHAVMRAVWVEGRDPADDEVLRSCARAAGLDAALVDRNSDAKDVLFAATEEAERRGAPGAPTFVVGDQLFWGQDRLHFVGKALSGWRVPSAGSRIPDSESVPR